VSLSLLQLCYFKDFIESKVMYWPDPLVFKSNSMFCDHLPVQDQGHKSTVNCCYHLETMTHY